MQDQLRKNMLPYPAIGLHSLVIYFRLGRREAFSCGFDHAQGGNTESLSRAILSFETVASLKILERHLSGCRLLHVFFAVLLRCSCARNPRHIRPLIGKWTSQQGNS